jgi:hypothetical protein
MNNQPTPLADDDLDHVTGGTSRGARSLGNETEADAEMLAAAQKILESVPAGFTGNISQFLSRAMMEHAAEQRQNALDMRLAERQAAKEQMFAQAGEMEAAADKMKNQAISNLVLSVVTASVGIAGTMSSVNKFGDLAALKMSDMAHEKSEMIGKGDKFEDLKSARDLEHGKQFEGGMGSLTNSLGSSFGSAQFSQAAAKTDEADAKRDAAEAEMHKMQGEANQHLQQGMSDMMKQIINFIKELKDAEVESMRSITRV